ncbi:AI-2E family transporter [Candidatus Kaiserbacteria bacterium]|nr:AI-2E family transporter [Candidatus Kaiserbacteria bacterium]
MPNATFSITTGTIIKTIVILFGAWLLYKLQDLALVILTAVVIASAIEPGVKALARYRVPRLISVILIYLLLIGLFLGLFYLFLPFVLEDVATFLATLPSYLNAFSSSGAFDEFSSILGLPVPSVSDAGNVLSQVRGAIGESGAYGNAFSAASSVFGGVLSFVLIIVFSFYFAVNETGVAEFLRFISPRKYESYVLDLWHRTRQKIGLWMQGQLILGLIMGVFVYLALTLIGVKHALLLAVLASMFELIPVFGPTLAAVPAVIIGFVDGGLGIGLLIVAVYVVLQQFENHLLYPLVVTKVVGVPPLLVILALIIGAKLAGFLGILLAVPAAAALQEYVKDVDARRKFASEGESV